jgi:hypothetical protein
MEHDHVDREKAVVWETPFQRYGFLNLRQSTKTVSVERLCGLLPRAVKADQTAERTSKTDNTIIKVDEAESAGRDGQIAQVGDQLKLGNALVPNSASLAK